MSLKPYILGQVVARGGMAEVYRGLHIGQDGFKRLVAIKRILAHHAQNAEFTEMFKDEAHIGQRLQHANIVKVEGFDIIDGSASIIMEFVDGSDLRALLSAVENRKQPVGKRGFFPTGLCAYIIAEAARGLHYAHTRRDDVTNRPLNIVHRDISPQNLLISWEGEVKITDFGIAAAERDFKLTETRAGIVKGKYSYMSPEQISGKKCDAKTDIFALCIVLWEMLAMRRLFSADNEIEVIEMVRQCKLPSKLKDLNPNVSDELESIVLRGLNKDPRRRYESMESFEKTLRSYLAKEHPSISASELSIFIKEYLNEKREIAQEEMRKILTSTQLPTAVTSSNTTRSREINFDESSSAKTSFTIGKSPAGLNSIPKASRTSHHISSPPSARLDRPPTHQTLSIRRRDPLNPPSKKNSTIYLAVAIVILGISGALFFKQYKNAAKKALTLTIRTSPNTVKIKLNDRDLMNGRYSTSPIKLKLEPGLNSIEVLRPGYANNKFLINTDDGLPQRTPAIKLTATSNFAPIRIEYRGAESATISVNDGFFKTQVIPPQSIEQVHDITSGTPSRLVLINKDRKIISTCNFTPVNTTATRPLIIKVTDSAKTCEILGPQRGVKP